MAPTPRLPFPMRPRRTAVLAAVYAAVLGGYASAGGAADGEADRPTAAASPSASAEDAPGSPSPAAPTGSASGPASSLLDVSGRSLDGGRIDLGTYAGEHLVLWMWAPW